MSKREEIKGNQKFDELKFGIVYTEVLGWLDMGHAGGDDISLLKGDRKIHSLGNPKRTYSG